MSESQGAIASLQTLTSITELEAVSTDWHMLLAKAEAANTFLTPEWIVPWWKAYQPKAELRVLVARKDNEFVGLAPMMVQHEKRYGLNVRCLRFLGDGTFESDHLGFLVRAPEADDIHKRLLDGLLTCEWDVAELANIPEGSRLAASLPDWCQRNGFLFEAVNAPCPIRQVPASFDELLASLPSRFRTSIRSTRKKLAAAHRVEFGQHDHPDELDHALETLFENHESRWRGKGQGGVFLNPRRRDFYRQLTRKLHEAGNLRFFYLKLDDRIVAQEYCFAHGRTVYLLQEGFAFDLASLNLGNALRSYVFEYLIERKYHAYDFLAGLSRHKQNWSDAVPNDVTFKISRATLKGRLLFNAPRWIEAAKSQLRPLRNRLRTSSPDTTSDPNVAAPQ